MTAPHVRPFRRTDRDQLTDLINAHVQAVVPGMTVSVNAVLNQLEREPGEYIVDPWVVERLTLVAEQQSRIVAAAHVLRYGSSDDVGATYRDSGEVRWLVSWPEPIVAPGAPAIDAVGAADAVLAGALAYLFRSGATRVHADGALPAPGVYGIPAVWPHIAAALTRAGFTPGDRTEVVLLADVDTLARTPRPRSDLVLARRVGTNGVRFVANRDTTCVGYLEVEARAELARSGGARGWAEVGNIWVDPAHRRGGIGRWLVGAAAEWLCLGHIDRLLDFAPADDVEYLGFATAVGFVELTRTSRGWCRRSMT